MIFFVFLWCLGLLAEERSLSVPSPMVLSSKRIFLNRYPTAFNPSLMKIDDEFILVFRVMDDKDLWISYIGIVCLDENFDPISEPELLSICRKTPSQSEDARIFRIQNRLFLTFNDNLDCKASYHERRDIYIAEIFRQGDHFSLSFAQILTHEQKYASQFWQKNWVPFEWNHKLLFVYSIVPHEIVYPNFLKEVCVTFSETKSLIPWAWGEPRGGTPAMLIDGEYLTFFHSSQRMKSSGSSDLLRYHYFMGAYTFSKDPPFTMTKISKEPIVGFDSYTDSNVEKKYVVFPGGYEKHVVFPAGYVVSGNRIYLAFGKNDCEMWIATLDKEALMNSLQPIESSQ